MAGGETRTCIICHQHKKAGLNILAAFICCDCEKKLVSTPCDDSAYEEFLQNLKRFWRGLQHKIKVEQH